MKQIAADVEEANRREELERQAAAMDAQQLRQQQGQYLHRQYVQALEDYEAQRGALHAVVGKVYAAAQAYAKVTGVTPNSFHEAMFVKINVPTLKPGEAWDWGSPFTTTQAAVMGYFANKATWV